MESYVRRKSTQTQTHMDLRGAMAAPSAPGSPPHVSLGRETCLDLVGKLTMPFDCSSHPTVMPCLFPQTSMILCTLLDAGILSPSRTWHHLRPAACQPYVHPTHASTQASDTVDRDQDSD